MNTSSMRIQGKKYLDANTYDEVIMDLVSDNRKIKFNCSKEYNFPTVPSKNKYSDDFPRGYSNDILLQDDIAMDVVDHFLNNTTINGLAIKRTIGYYPGMKWSIIQSDDRRLCIRLGGFFAKDINIKILGSYFLNRDRYCFDKNNQIEKIRNTYDCMYYGDELGLPLNNKGELSLMDERFLKEFLNDRFDQEHKAEIIDNAPYWPCGQFYATKWYAACGDLKIEIDQTLIPIVCPIIKNYNEELEETKSKQLVLDGFSK